MVALPLPAATSSTRQPAWRSAASHRCSAWKTIRAATTEKSPLAQVVCCRDFTAAKSGTGTGRGWSVTFMSLTLEVSGRSIDSTIVRSFDNTNGRAIMSSMSSNNSATVRADLGTRSVRKPRADGVASRRAILQAAANLATTRGLEVLSIGELAEHIGMSKSGLYAHFKSKEELELATIET